MPALSSRAVHGLAAAMSGAGAVALLVLVHGVATGQLAGIDARLHDALALDPETQQNGIVWARRAAVAGSPEVAVAALVAVGAVAWRLPLWRRFACAALAITAVSTALELGIKLLLDHPGPFGVGEGQLLVGLGLRSSFPSGHAVRIVLVAAVILVLSPPLLRLALSPLIALVVAAVLWSRLALAVHWADDVAGGIALALLLIPILLVAAPRSPAEATGVLSRDPGRNHAGARSG